MTGLFLGLILQLSQVSASITQCLNRPAPCQSSATCNCTKSQKACACAKSSEHKPTPSPSLPDGKSVKLDPIVPGAREPLAFVSYIPPPVTGPAAAYPMSLKGHAGLSLNVSFCRFII